MIKKHFFPKFAPILRKRWGINISEPVLYEPLINDDLLKKLKTETIGDDFIFL